MKKKIIFFHPYFNSGGVEKTNMRLGKFFLSKGYLVDFLSISFSSHLTKEIKDLGINIVDLKKGKTSEAVLSIRSYVKEQKKEYSLVFISCQNYANIISVISLFGLRDKMKLILTERNNPISLRMSSNHKLKHRIIWSMMKLTYKHADEVVAISKELADDLSLIIKRDVKCIYNPTMSEDFITFSNESVSEKWFYEDIPIVISAGRLSKQKDYVTLIKAFNEVIKEKDCRLFIIGEGEEKENLEYLINQLNLKDKVLLGGYDSNPHKYIKKASVFVVSSIYEGLCNVLIEAAAVKIPCVSTRCKSGPREILLDGKGGRLVDIYDYKNMAIAILDTLNNSEKANEKANVAYENLYRFTPDVVASKYIDLFESERNV